MTGWISTEPDRICVTEKHKKAYRQLSQQK